METKMSKSYRGEPNVTVEITIEPSFISTIDPDITVAITIAQEQTPSNIPIEIMRNSIPDRNHKKIKMVFDKKNPIEVTVYQSYISDQFYSPVLYEIDRKEGAARLVLYKDNQHADISMFFYKLIDHPDHQLYIDISTLSTVICFSTEPDRTKITDDTLLLWCYFENNSQSNALLIDGNVQSRNQFTQNVTEFEQRHEKSCVFDIDKTIGMIHDSFTYYEKHKGRTDFECNGYMSATNEYFRHDFMMRDGLYDAIRLLQEQGITIYFMTWADIMYGRSIINHLNHLNWKNKTETRKETDKKIHIPITHVFSRRNTQRKALPKHFVHAVPFYTSETTLKCMGIDDDPGAWDVEVRNRIYPILPFSPLYNHNMHLLMAVEEIIARLR
jgi:hypothetical protein